MTPEMRMFPVSLMESPKLKIALYGLDNVADESVCAPERLTPVMARARKMSNFMAED